MENKTNLDISFSTSYEIKKFDEICAELLILDKVFPTVENAWDAATRPNKKADVLLDARREKESLASLSAIWNIFVQLIKRHKEEAESLLSQADQKTFDEVLFVAVSLIDEYFLRKERFVYEYWKINLLEFYFFKTRSAGEVFYQNIDEILQQNNTTKKNVAFIYLQALSMGFKGKYFHHGNKSDILYYKKAIYSFLFNKNMFVLDESAAPQLRNGEYISLHAREKLLAYNRKTYLFILFLVLSYVIATYIIWYQKVYSIDVMLKRINAPMEQIIK